MVTQLKWWQRQRSNHIVTTTICPPLPTLCMFIITFNPHNNWSHHLHLKEEESSSLRGYIPVKVTQQISGRAQIWTPKSRPLTITCTDSLRHLPSTYTEFNLCHSREGVRAGVWRRILRNDSRQRQCALVRKFHLGRGWVFPCPVADRAASFSQHKFQLGIWHQPRVI